MTLYPEVPEWGELFDLDNDPLEYVNRFHDAELATVRAELTELLQQEFPPQAEVKNQLLAKW